MTSKGLGILGTWLLFAVLPAFTQVPSGLASPLTTAGITPLQLAPMALDGPLLGSTAQSTLLYSGYAVTGSLFTQAKGSWHVPGVNCGKTPNATSAFWVGMDGIFADSATAEETGTVSACNGSTPQYYAWYQFSVDNSIVTIGSVPVKDGNIMSAEVSYKGSNRFTIKITNETTGKSFSKTSVVVGARREGAEWIASGLCCTSGGGLYPLADFVKANFGDDLTGISGTNYATDESIAGPISDFGKSIIEVTMVNGSGVTKAKPSALSIDGTSFSVTWKHE